MLRLPLLVWSSRRAVSDFTVAGPSCPAAASPDGSVVCTAVTYAPSCWASGPIRSAIATTVGPHTTTENT